MNRLRIPCPFGDGECTGILELEIALKDRSVGILASTIESVSGACPHINRAQLAVENPQENADLELLYKAFEDELNTRFDDAHEYFKDED